MTAGYQGGDDGNQAHRAFCPGEYGSHLGNLSVLHHRYEMMQNGQITPTATILTWIQSTMLLISVITSLVAGCHLYSKHRGNMRKLGLALILVFIAWLLCSNLLPTAVFYLADNTQQTAFTSVNIISMITTTSAYIYAYYMMYRAIND